MQVKKFEAPTMAEALNMVKTELGPEAIILSTKNHRKGFGLLSKASVEVTAAVAEKSLMKKQLTEKVAPAPAREAIGRLSAEKQAAIYNEFTGYYERRRGERGAREQGSGATAAGRPAAAQPGRAQQAARAAVSHHPILANAEVASEKVRVSRGGGAFAKSVQSGVPNIGAKTPGKVSGPPRYIDIPDDDADEVPRQSKGYGRDGRIQRAPAIETPAEPARSMLAAGPSPAHTDVRALQDDIQALKTMLEELKSEQMTLLDSKIPESPSDELQVEFRNLLNNGIDKRYATPLIKQVSFSSPRETLSNSDKIIEALAVEMMENIKVDNPLDFKPGSERRVFALVGPTGVGKTTTIAKLASQAILQKNLRVGLINVDSYKVAALDQLATYAKILNVPFRQASNAVELDRALQEFKPLDLVLIDTSGRSQRDSESLTQMKALLSECAAARPLLIMSATTRDQELYDIIARFKIFNPTGLVFSKLDETSTFGCIYNVAVRTNLPLTYFTVGQRVPEDLEPASRERVAGLILDL